MLIQVFSFLLGKRLGNEENNNYNYNYNKSSNSIGLMVKIQMYLYERRLFAFILVRV